MQGYVNEDNMKWDDRETATKIFQVYHFMEYIYALTWESTHPIIRKVR